LPVEEVLELLPQCLSENGYVLIGKRAGYVSREVLAILRTQFGEAEQLPVKVNYPRDYYKIVGRIPTDLSVG